MRIALVDSDLELECSDKMEKAQLQPIEILDDEDDSNSRNDWTQLPSLILSKIFGYFTERELRKIALVSKMWSQEVAMVINAKKINVDGNSSDEQKPLCSASTESQDLTESEPTNIDLTETEEDSSETKIRVVPNNFLKTTEKNVIDLSTDADVIDLCEENQIGRSEKSINSSSWQTISSRRFSKTVGKNIVPSSGGDTWQSISSQRYSSPIFRSSAINSAGNGPSVQPISTIISQPRLPVSITSRSILGPVPRNPVVGPVPRNPVGRNFGPNLSPSFGRPPNMILPQRLILRPAMDQRPRPPTIALMEHIIIGSVPSMRNSTVPEPATPQIDNRKRSHPPNSAAETSTKISKTDLKVAIIDQNSRNGFICDQIWIEFRRQMCNAVLNYITRNPSCSDPVFFYTGLENDRRWYQCEDEFALNFLKSSVSEMGPIWPNVKLRVDTFKNINLRRKAEICVNNSNLTAYEVTTLILSANPGLVRSDILVSTFKKKPNEQVLIIDMTLEVSDYIRKRNCNLFFGFQQIKVNFLPDEEIVL